MERSKERIVGYLTKVQMKREGIYTMEKKALYNLSYGVFMLSTRSGEKANGCITNTCIQVANDPVRIAISVLNSNYTCELIKESVVLEYK